MIYDEYADREKNNRGTMLCENQEKHISGGRLYGCYRICDKRKGSRENAIQCYMDKASKVDTVGDGSPWLKLHLEPSFENLHFKNQIGIEVEFKLETQFYSKDDRPFHVLDNPINKDWIFGIPYISASTWKGALRWAYRMEDDLIEKLGQSQKIIDSHEIIHLFGNEKEETTNFLQGALRFFPTFFYKVDFEVINPHNRTTKTGTMPIYYEVVPKDQEGTLRLLYSPAHPGKIAFKLNECKAMMENLINSIKMLLETYGISAKRTSGWGACSIIKWRFKFNKESIESSNPGEAEISNIIEKIYKKINNSEEAPAEGKWPGYLIV
jgi:CRISPR-associated protein Cmr2